jgi:hypothetical protein
MRHISFGQQHQSSSCDWSQPVQVWCTCFWSLLLGLTQQHSVLAGFQNNCLASESQDVAHA